MRLETSLKLANEWKVTTRGTLQTFIYFTAFNLGTILWARYYCYSFTKEEIKAQLKSLSGSTISHWVFAKCRTEVSRIANQKHILLLQSLQSYNYTTEYEITALEHAANENLRCHIKEPIKSLVCGWGMLSQGGDESEIRRQSWWGEVGSGLSVPQAKERVCVGCHGMRAEFEVPIRKIVWLDHKKPGGKNTVQDLA